MRGLRLWVVAVLTVGLMAGCTASGTVGSAAEEEVCSAKAALVASVQKVADDVKAVNLGQAHTDWKTVKADAAALGQAVQRLAEEKKAQLAPQVEALKTTLATVTDATSLPELEATLQTAKRQLAEIVSTATTIAGCTPT